MGDPLAPAAARTADLARLSPPELPAPRGYAHVVRVSADALVFVSGQVPFDAAGRLVGKGDVRAQTRQVFENVRLALAAAGATFEDVVKITIFVVGLDAERLAAIREVRDGVLPPAAPPASSLAGVAALFHPDVLVEIEAVAALGARG